MRAAILMIAISAAQAAVVSRDWADGKLALRLDDGVAEIEWLSGTSFRFARGTASLPVLPRIKHEAVASDFEDSRPALKLRGRYISIEIDKATANLRVSANNELIATIGIDKEPEGLTLHVAPTSRVFGLSGSGDSQRFFFTSGYGIFVRAPRDAMFDLAGGVVRAPVSMEIMFYYGPTPKEIFEQHQIVTGKTELTPHALHLPSADRLGPAETPLPETSLDSWEALDRFTKTLDAWSLSAVLYPVLNLSTINAARGEIAKRAEDLATMLPLLYGDASHINAGVRAAWTPYLVTYLREAYDRGFPLIRPFPMQFAHDKGLVPQPGVFMLGDEVLLAPVVAPGARRSLNLPRGLWTDLRTNVEYKGNQPIDVEAPTGRVPMFARSGALFPLAAPHAMELHYLPSLGGEFFLWEADKQDNSQFHAAPAGEFTRVEIESQVARTYEWVLHHTNPPIAVAEESVTYKPVRQRSALKPGTWWHDDARNDLHVMLHAEAGSDRIVNISF